MSEAQEVRVDRAALHAGLVELARRPRRGREPNDLKPLAAVDRGEHTERGRLAGASGSVEQIDRLAALGDLFHRLALLVG